MDMSSPEMQSMLAQILMRNPTQTLKPAPTATPPVQGNYSSSNAPMASPMQGIAQVGQAAADAYRRSRAPNNQAFPAAPGSGIFGLLRNPFASAPTGTGGLL